MAVDLATLGLTIEKAGVDAATASLGKLNDAAQKVSATTKDLNRSTEQATTFAKMRADSEARVAERQRELAAAMEAANAATNASAVAHETATKSAMGHGLQLGRLNMELGTFIGRLTGSNTAVTRLGAMLGGNVVGYAQMIGGLVAISGLLWVFEKMTSGAKESADAITKLKDEIKKAQEATGDFALATAKKNREDAELALAKARNAALGSGPDGGVDPLFQKLVDKRKRELEEATTILLQAQQDKAAIDARTKAESERDYADQLALLVSHNQATANERQRALDLYKRNAAEITALGQSQTDNVRRAQLIQQNDALSAAFKTSTREDDAVFKASIEQRATEWNFFVKENQRAYKQAGEETVREFERQEDEKTAYAIQQQAEQTRNAQAEYKRQSDAAVAEFKKRQQYADDLQKIWDRGISAIVTRGLDSFSSFFDSVFQLFTRLIERMQREGESSPVLQGLTAALGGGLAGYSIGKSGGYGAGLFGGAAAGGAVGYEYAGPLGAAIGGLVGAAAGLFGASQAQNEAAAALHKAVMEEYQKFTEQRDSYLTGPLDDFAKRIADENATYEALKRAWQASGEYFGIEEQDKLNAAHQRNIDAINAEIAARDASTALLNQRAEEDLSVRLLTAQGSTRAADDLAFRLRQQREFEDAKSSGKSQDFLDLLTSVQVQEAIQRAQSQAIADQTKTIQDAAAAQQAALETQIQTAQEALKVSQDSLREQEKTVQATQRAVDALTQFANGLSLNPSLTTLSPVQQRAEAQRQYEAQLALAKGGDAAAATGLPAIAQAFLTSSRTVNASGASYVADFLKVQADVQALTGQYGTQLTVEQQTLKLLQDTVSALQAQIAVLQEAKDQAAKDAQRQIDALNTTSFYIQKSIDKLPGHTDSLGGSGTDLDFSAVSDRLDTANTYLSASVNVQQGGFQMVADAVADVGNRVSRLESALAGINARGLGL